LFPSQLSTVFSPQASSKRWPDSFADGPSSAGPQRHPTHSAPSLPA
jgi:hypothetical protein